MKERVVCNRGIWLCGLVTVFALIAFVPVSAQAVITEIIDSTGAGALDTFFEPWAIAVDGDGNVYVAGNSSNNAFKIAPFGFITEIIDSDGDDAGNGLLRPTGIAVDGAGNVYVVGDGSRNAFKITPGGVISEIIDSTGDGAGNGFGFGQGIAVDDAGNVYVTASSTGNAFKISTPGTCSTGGTPCTITEIIDSTGDGNGVNQLSNVRGIAVDGVENVYVVAAGQDHAFKISTPGTCSTGGTPCTITKIIDANGDNAGNTLDNPWAIAVDGDGNVYVAGASSPHNAFKIDTPGTCSTGGTPCTITEIIDFDDGLQGPRGIAVDVAGNVYVAGNASENAFKITPGGVITEIIDSTGDGAGNTLDLARGIAVDGVGNVYVAGGGSNNAFKIGEPVFLIPALSLRGSLIALLLLFVGVALAGLSRRRSRRVTSA